MSKETDQIEQMVEKALSLLQLISAKEKARALNRKKPIGPCEIIDETEEKPRRCVDCIPHLPKDHPTRCGCQLVVQKRGVAIYDQ